MKALLVTWLAEWAASPLTTRHVLGSWNMVFTELPMTESMDDVDLSCPSAAIPTPAPLPSVVPGPVSDSEEASRDADSQRIQFEFAEFAANSFAARIRCEFGLKFLVLRIRGEFGAYLHYLGKKLPREKNGRQRGIKGGFATCPKGYERKICGL